MSFFSPFGHIELHLYRIQLLLPGPACQRGRLVLGRDPWAVLEKRIISAKGALSYMGTGASDVRDVPGWCEGKDRPGETEAEWG